jgi:outer membrane protein assembly factor BamB
VLPAVIDRNELVPPVAPRRRWPYRVLFAVVAPAFIGLLGAATPVPSQPVPTSAIIAAGYSDSTFVDGDLLFVAGPGPAGTQALRVFHLPDGRPAGRIKLHISRPVTAVTLTGATLLITVNNPAETVAVDVATGLEIWQSGATVFAASGSTVVMTSAQSDDTGAAFAVNARTGDTLWRVRRPDNGMIIVAGLPSQNNYMPGLRTGWAPLTRLPRWLVTTSGSGRITAYDGRTGRPAGTAATSIPGKSAVTYLAGNRFAYGTGPAGLTWYTLPTMTPAGHVDVDHRTDYLQPDCVQVLCAYLGQQGVAVLDSVTGRTRWASNRWSSLEPLGPGLLALGPTSDTDPTLYRVDPATGRPRGDLGRWTPVTGPDGTIRYAVDVNTDGSAWFGEPDPTRPIIHLLGRAPDVSGHCDVGADSLIYRRTDGSIAVLRLPGAARQPYVAK